MLVMKFKGGDKMALSDDFKEAVLQNKKTKVRIMMKDSLLMDSTGATFDEMANYAAKPGFMDEHDGEVFKPSAEWNEDYLNEQMVAVAIHNHECRRPVVDMQHVELRRIERLQTSVGASRTGFIHSLEADADF